MQKDLDRIETLATSSAQQLSGDGSTNSKPSHELDCAILAAHVRGYSDREIADSAGFSTARVSEHCRAALQSLVWEDTNGIHAQNSRDTTFRADVAPGLTAHVKAEYLATHLTISYWFADDRSGRIGFGTSEDLDSPMLSAMSGAHIAVENLLAQTLRNMNQKMKNSDTKEASDVLSKMGKPCSENVSKYGLFSSLKHLLGELYLTTKNNHHNLSYKVDKMIARAQK